MKTAQIFRNSKVSLSTYFEDLHTIGMLLWNLYFNDVVFQKLCGFYLFITTYCYR